MRSLWRPRARLAATAALVALGGGGQASATDAALQLRRIVLSQGGVGYFEYAAQVDGAATLGFDVPRGQVSDVLASMVVLDAAGSVEGVDLPSSHSDPAALAGLPIPRAALDHPLDLLNALQGVVVSVAGATPLTGRVLHAELLPATGGPGARPGRIRVTLLTDAGLQQFVLEDVAAVQLADPRLRARLDAALASLRGGAAADRRHVRVHLTGPGKRAVHLGVVVGAPLWKASYRLLVLPDDGTDATPKARLQGWAVLENAGLQDWSEVTLTLQSGNPVALHQDLYQTYMVERPTVPVDMRAHPAPPVDAGAAMAPMAMMAPAPAMAPPAMNMRMAPASAAAQTAQGVVQTAFTLAAAFSLPVGHSAAVPFLDTQMQAERVDMLASDAAHPLVAIRLVNDTGLALPPGLVTTYDQTGFAGDALLGALPAGQTRLLSFAEDAAVTASWQHAATTSLAGITAAHGVLRITRRERTSTTLDLQAPGALMVSVEIPDPGDAVLTTEPALPVERTAGGWRVAVRLGAGERRRVVAHADHLESSVTAIGADPDILGVVLDDQTLPASARAALQRVGDLQRAVAERSEAGARLLADRRGIETDEARLRANLAAVLATDPLHGQLLRALAADEAALAGLAGQQQQAEGSIAAARQALAAAIAALDI